MKPICIFLLGLMMALQTSYSRGQTPPDLSQDYRILSPFYSVHGNDLNHFEGISYKYGLTDQPPYRIAVQFTNSSYADYQMKFAIRDLTTGQAILLDPVHNAHFASETLQANSDGTLWAGEIRSFKDSFSLRVWDANGDYFDQKPVSIIHTWKIQPQEMSIPKTPAPTSTTTTVTFLMWIGTSLLILYWAWRLAQQLFRNKKNWTRKQIFQLSIDGILFFSLCGFGFFSANRFWKERRTILLNHIQSTFDIKNDVAQRFATRSGDLSKIPTVALWGDSDAGSLCTSLDRVLKAKKLGGEFFVLPGYPPALGVYRADLGNSQNDMKLNQRMLHFILIHPNLSTVILLARWSLYIEETRVDNGEGGVEVGTPPRLLPIGKITSPEERKNTIARLMVETIRKLIAAKKRVILVYSVPEIGYDVPVADAEALRSGAPPVSISYFYYLKRNRFIFQLFDSLPEGPFLKKVRPAEVLRDSTGTRCMTMLNGKILYIDSHHLSVAGSDRVVSEIEPYLLKR